MHEPNIIPREEPTLIGEVLSFHREDLAYTDQQLESALHMFAPEIRTTLLTRGVATHATAREVA